MTFPGLRVALVGAALLCPGGVALAATATDLYGQAVEARRAGNLETAIQRLEEARRLVPRDADVLLLLGQVYGFQRRFDEALTTLREARRLAPAYADIGVAIARIHSFEGGFAEAEGELAEVLARHPDNIEALTLRARVAYYRRDLDAAEAGFEAVLARAPGALDALLGLGDVALARGDVETARARYEQAGLIAPDDHEVTRRLADLDTSAKPLWRLDLGSGYGGFARAGQESWRDTFAQIGYEIDPRTRVHGRVERDSHYGAVDLHLEVGLDRRVNEWLSAAASIGITPDADFLARWAVRGEAAARVRQGGDTLGATLLTLDGRWADYDGDGIATANPGIVQYLFDGRLWLTGRWLNTRDEAGDWRGGWYGRADVQATAALRLHLGASHAVEAEAGATYEADTLFAGATYELAPSLTLRLDVEREKREPDSVRNGVILGLGYRF
ncbi:MAG TPA: YaiO family outer membrane beta-barrel protein [Azospirillaceae bacterium]|nr:YaiO family outer membrane beta-barrel protein [Azospirillaceae bacterium]